MDGLPCICFGREKNNPPLGGIKVYLKSDIIPYRIVKNGERIIPSI
jgi:hypothetical protein